MKKIINDPNNVVGDMLKGMQISNPNIIYNSEKDVIARKIKSNKVGLVSGGGSGHEPAHAGYVGYGMLDAAVCGNVFASPSPDQILEGIHLADSGNGVLMIVKNYAGDIMNFEIAQELAGMEDIQVDHVVVKDDVSVKDSEDSTGRRGIAGTVFVHKIAGAKAETGANLEEVKRVANKVIENVRSFGVSLSPCTIPAVGKPGFHIGEDEMEVGMGIHGEAGIETTTLKPSKEIAKLIVEKILADKDFGDSEVAVMINGMGATPLMELYILAGDVNDVLIDKGLHPVKYYVGNYMTSIEMAGASCTILKLDDELKELLLSPCDTPALKQEVSK
jgi:dihydroxyacetone kinase-like protein